MPLDQFSKCPFIAQLDFVGWGRWVHRFDSRLQLYDSDLMVASLYCWEKRLFPLAYVEVEADNEGRILAIECRDDEWALDYEMPPSRSCRFALLGCRALTRHMDAELLSK